MTGHRLIRDRVTLAMSCFVDGLKTSRQMNSLELHALFFKVYSSMSFEQLVEVQ